MQRSWIILAALLGLGATALPASADITYVLDCSATPCPANSNNYGTTSLVPTGVGHPLPAGGIYNTSHYNIQDNTDHGHTYKASPFGSNWMYAIDTNQNGGKSTNDNYLIFDVTKTNGLLIGDFAAIDGFYFAVDMLGGPCGPTCVVASNKTTIPEPGTVLMILAGLGSLFMLHQRRRKLVRAA